MFLELAEALDCPECGDGVGLVAFVDVGERRRVIEGRLGCPICEIEYPIGGGVIDFSSDDAPAPVTAPREVAPDLPLRLAALLGLSEREGSIVLLGPGLAAHAPDVARLAEKIEILAWLASAPEAGSEGFDREALAAGVDPLHGASAERWPVRSSFLHGVALLDPPPPMLREAGRCVRAEGRLVLLSPDEEARSAAARSGFRELAAEGGIWVGERA